MTPIVLWMYGLLVVSSLIMVLAWGNAAQKLARDRASSFPALVWCKPFMIAGGLTVHAVFMAAASGYRAFDIMANELPVLGSEAAVQVIVMSGLGISKIMFVWAGSIEEHPRHVRWTWYAYLYFLMLWGLTVWSWAIGWEL
jgi:hypothetical protein